MKCIIVDDEPIARLGLAALVDKISQLQLVGSFEDAESASEFMLDKTVDLAFLDIQMPGINGINFAKKIPRTTLVIFTTAYSEYALDSYDVDAIDYLVKPIEEDRLAKAVQKAVAYHTLLMNEEKGNMGDIKSDHIFVKSERKFFKIYYRDILFIEGLKDYIIIQTENKRIITKMYLKNILELLPHNIFFRINRSYIVNLNRIESFNNNDIFINIYEIGIGNNYREAFFQRIIPEKR
ncbi:LytR/AlgR family response regulator transcription factor [Apibacter adventoris]|uniref:LytR/AlgR family response regulator transcription factor n=1 Tax=Apibacter adventoris TaxID=1679466 RepID=UPI000CF6B154|nr:LytTR family DNA-binding domain-containing protein [Apibacter adventoris]PQL91939.1 DNA-binding response regulator [Apibacter adventoris]